MNKKIFALALSALAVLGSTSASAQVTVINSGDNIGHGYVQTLDAQAAAGGGSVRANDLIIRSTSTDIPVASASTDGKITIRLPKGLNFDGDPTFVVTPATAGLGLTLTDVDGDPTINSATSSPTITYSDQNGDGGNDKAVLTVARAAAAGDSMTVSINLTVATGTAAGTKAASVIINGGIATSNVVDVKTGFSEPVWAAATPITVDQTTGPETLTLSSQLFTVTVPKGTAAAATLTISAGSRIAFQPGTGVITAYVRSPLKANPFSAMTATAATSATASVNFNLASKTTDDVQVEFKIQEAWLKAGTATVGVNGLKLTGVAVGDANLLSVKANGSTAARASGAAGKLAAIVAGSAAVQTLPAIVITENFSGDAITKGSTAVITFTPSTGLTLVATTPTVTVGYGTTELSATITAGKLNLTISANAGGTTKTITITGLQAKATATAAGTLSVTVTGSQAKAPDKVAVEVATASARGTVSATLKAGEATKKTGPGGASVTSNLVLVESTYGALTIAEETQSTKAYFTVTPSSNAKISTITTTFSGYDAGNTPTISTCQAETATSLVYVCQVTAESKTLVQAGTTTISPEIRLAVTYAASAKAEIGSDVVLTLGGNAGLSGEIKVASVGQTTKAAVTGAVPDVKPGSLTAASLATVTITELFTNAVTNTVGSSFRVIAPAGAAFQDAAAIQASSTTVGTATISSTFRPNDTLTLTRVGTATITFTAKAIFSADAASGLASFDIVDGDINGKSLSNIAAATLELAYVDGTLEKLDAGKAAAVNVGFSVSNTVEGGLAPYTVASSASTIATATVSGSAVSVEGVAAGAATITVTDALGATSAYVVTVSAGAAEPAQGKATKASDGSESAATFTGGATIDGGTTYTDAITTADDVIINATITVDPDDVGEAGGIHAVVLSPAGLLMLESDGSWVPWDGVIAHVATYLEVDALAATYSVPLYNGAIATAGKWRFAVVYSTDTGKLVYTTKAAMVTVTEAE
jgi:hypothetical protein